MSATPYPPITRTVARRGWLLLLPLALAAGCQSAQTRGQMADDDGRPEIFKEVLTIGDVTDVDNAMPVQVSGVGLVTGLDGTGGPCPPGSFRTLLEEELRKQRVQRIKEVLDSPDNAIVLITGLIPPGGRKGDPIDVQVSLPQGSRATSLRGGYLHVCSLRNYESKQNIAPGYEGGSGLLPGHVLAHARGPVLIGFDGDGDGSSEVRGRIWHGGVSLIDRPFMLALKNDRKFAQVAHLVATRINHLFPADSVRQQRVQEYRRLFVLDEVAGQLNHKYKPAAGSRAEMAKAVTKDTVQLRVPYAYRHNPDRYLRVALKIPLREAQESQAKYRKELRRLLNEPEHTVAAAMRLEALGKESVPALKESLHHEHPLVRFVAAEALAYLESQGGVEELAKLGGQYAALRAYCLTALASMEEGVCVNQLIKLMASDNAEMRYGAFRALRMQDEPIDAVEGELLNESFWLHRVAEKSLPMVHVTTGQRAEVVLFGEPARLVAPFRISAGEFVVTAERGDDRCTVGRFVTRGEKPWFDRKQCSFRVEDVLRTVAALGGHYPDAVELLRQVDHARVMTSPLVTDATPITVALEDLAQEGKSLKLLVEGAAPERPSGYINQFRPDTFDSGLTPPGTFTPDGR